MQLILETDNTNISISEKMSTLDQETSDKLVSKGEIKELLEEVHRKSEKNIIDKEIENKENVTANTEDHKDSGDTTALQPSNEDDSSAKSEELNGEQLENQSINENMVNVEEPDSEIININNVEAPSNEQKGEDINLSITVQSKAKIDESKTNLNSPLKNDDSQKDLASKQNPLENNGTCGLQCSENLKEPQMDIGENKSDLDTQVKNYNNQKEFASEESPVENNGIRKLQVSENVKESKIDIVVNKDIIEENKIDKQKNEVPTKTLNEIVEHMEVDCDIGRNLEEKVTESISAMVNEIVENLNHDDTSGYLVSEAAKVKNLEIETTCEDEVGSKANMNITETETTCKDEVESKTNMDITEMETTCETDSETKVDDKQITNSIDKIKENVLSDRTENISTQCEILATVSAACFEEEPPVSSTLNGNSVKIAAEINKPHYDCNTVNNQLEKTDNPEKENSTAEVTGDKNAKDCSVVEKAFEQKDNTEKAIPMETELLEKKSASDDENVQCDSIVKKDNNSKKDMEEVLTPLKCTKEGMKTDLSMPLEYLDVKNAKKKVTVDESVTIRSSGSENIVEKAAEASSTTEPDSIQNIVPEDITKEKDTFSDDVEEVKLVEDNLVQPQSQKHDEKTPEIVIDAKQPSSIIKLSNTMDILSDDDEDEGFTKASKEELKPQEREVESADKHCINLDDDDDVMLIDEEVSKDDKKDIPSVEAQVEDVAEPKCEDKVVELDTSKEGKRKEEEAKDIRIASPKSPSESKAPILESEKVTSEVPEKPAQLVPDDFFKTYRKNLADMTRDDLEEFCILKIVESIIDRSNINEIRLKLKTMSQTVEEYKKKATMLTKQNRDLQVVLKSVQEEQKKMTNQSITPLKIMRSVGMQVLMTDKTRRRPPGPGVALNSPTASNVSQVNNNVNNTNITNNRQQRNINLSPRGTPSKQTTNQPIPVPRLVPAAQNMANRNLAGPPPAGKTGNVQNGIKIASPSQKVPEKRTHARAQSVTVDLTDDEPPPKLPAKNPPAPPVRLVNTQNLLAQRPQLPQAVNSPRKVFIPINLTGPPAQNVRPGQTVFLKTPSPQGPRPRGQGTLPPIRPKQNNIPVKRVQGARHPAPLPDAMKQYQPPNWKALPPAPDLKLSKVENGIVISWKIEGYQEDSYEEIASYQLYAYQETSAPPSTSLWKKIGDVKALPLPMACTLTQFMAGYKYYFAVRAVDVRSRLGPFSLPGSILLLNKM